MAASRSTSVSSINQSDKSTFCYCSLRDSWNVSVKSPSPTLSRRTYTDSEDYDIKKEDSESEDENQENIYESIDIKAVTEQHIEPVAGVNENICRDLYLCEEQRKIILNNTKLSSSVIKRCVRGTCSLCFLGFLLVCVGVLILFGSYSISKIAPDEKYVEGGLPRTLSCLTMIFCGIIAIITKYLRKRKAVKKHYILIIIVLILSLICTAFCVCSLIYLITVIRKSLNQLDECVVDELDRSCSCYDPNKRLFKFAGNMECGAVKNSLKELAYGVSVLFGVGFVVSVATALSATFLLCKEKRDRYKRAALRNIHHTSYRRHTTPHPLLSSETTFEIQTTSSAELHHHSIEQPEIMSFQWFKEQDRATKTATTTLTSKNSSVATQTPSFMMPVSSLLYDITTDDAASEYSLELMDPPSYSDAIKS